MKCIKPKLRKFSWKISLSLKIRWLILWIGKSISSERIWNQKIWSKKQLWDVDMKKIGKENSKIKTKTSNSNMMLNTSKSKNLSSNQIWELRFKNGEVILKPVRENFDPCKMSSSKIRTNWNWFQLITKTFKETMCSKLHICNKLTVILTRFMKSAQSWSRTLRSQQKWKINLKKIWKFKITKCKSSNMSTKTRSQSGKKKKETCKQESTSLWPNQIKWDMTATNKSKTSSTSIMTIKLSSRRPI